MFFLQRLRPIGTSCTGCCLPGPRQGLPARSDLPPGRVRSAVAGSPSIYGLDGSGLCRDKATGPEFLWPFSSGPESSAESSGRSDVLLSPR